MFNGLTFNIIAILLFKIPASGLFSKILALIGGIFVVIGTLVAVINFFISIKDFKQNIPKFVTSSLALILGVYGLIQVIHALPLIKSMF